MPVWSLSASIQTWTSGGRFGVYSATVFFWISADEGSGAGGSVTKWQQHRPATQRAMVIRVKNLVIMGSGVSEVLREIEDSGEKRADVLAKAVTDFDIKATVCGDIERSASGVGLSRAGILNRDFAGACGDFHDFCGGSSEIERTRRDDTKGFT